MTARHLVFVYGTLMREGQHHDVLAGARFLRAAQTLPNYELVYIEYYPALLRGGATRVVGELYEVDTATLARLDELEEVPAYYLRERILLADGSEAETYIMPRERAPVGEPIGSGDFRAHCATLKRS